MKKFCFTARAFAGHILWMNLPRSSIYTRRKDAPPPELPQGKVFPFFRMKQISFRLHLNIEPKESNLVLPLPGYANQYTRFRANSEVAYFSLITEIQPKANLFSLRGWMTFHLNYCGRGPHSHRPAGKSQDYASCVLLQRRQPPWSSLDFTTFGRHWRADLQLCHPSSKRKLFYFKEHTKFLPCRYLTTKCP